MLHLAVSPVCPPPPPFSPRPLAAPPQSLRPAPPVSAESPPPTPQGYKSHQEAARTSCCKTQKPGYLCPTQGQKRPSFHLRPRPPPGLRVLTRFPPASSDGIPSRSPQPSSSVPSTGQGRPKFYHLGKTKPKPPPRTLYPLWVPCPILPFTTHLSHRIILLNSSFP